MFSSRESFRSIENFVDHIADVVSSSFHSTKAALEAEIVTLRAESKETIDGFKYDLQAALARLDAAEQHVAEIPTLVRAETAKLFADAESKWNDEVEKLLSKPVNMPPASMPSETSQDEKEIPDRGY